MRISDWSSDVCSSDLRNDRVPVHIETSHPITDPSHRIYPLQAQRPPEGNQERIRICGSCSKRHSPVPRVPHQTDNGLEAPRNNDDHTRSEEHTSELQSLMRHSYAVFRLQNKKQQ